MTDTGHEVIIWAIAGLGGVFLTISGVLFGILLSIVRDHVQRKEMEALRKRLDDNVAIVSTVVERVDDIRARLSYMEGKRVN